MKTVNSLVLSLIIAVGFSSPLAWAGEPNPDALGQGQSTKAMPGDCGPDMTMTYGEDSRAD